MKKIGTDLRLLLYIALGFITLLSGLFTIMPPLHCYIPFGEIFGLSAAVWLLIFIIAMIKKYERIG